ncbi:MAG: dethiobiotin synthase [Planctomycetota bacterium]
MDAALRRELDERAQRGLRRSTQLDGRVAGLDFGSNDYLGLARDPEIVDAMVAAAREFGAGGRSARLLAGGSPLHEAAEAAAAAWLDAEAALLFPSGYQANVGLLAALAGRGDAIVSDRENHASLIDAARLSRARVVVHEHLDLSDLERALRATRGARRRFVVTEGVFSMAGDVAPLAEIDALCRRDDAWLIVDEAHAAGVLGPEGRGAWATSAVSGAHRLCARVVTGGKALGLAGAFVVGSGTLREHLIHAARSFLFTTAPPPALAGGLVAAVRRCRGADAERARVRRHAKTVAAGLGLPVPAAAIVPVPVGDAARAAALADELRAAGCYAPAVRPPTVPPGRSGLRVVCHASHTDADVARLLEQLAGRVHPSPVLSAPTASRPPTFIVGTDTGVGKTVVSALLLRAARQQGDARYWKPVQTGDDDDTATVAALSAAPASALLPNLAWYPLPASPHEAAAAAGTQVPRDELDPALRAHGADRPNDHLLVELAGGLLVPYAAEPMFTQADWLAATPARLVLVARSGLGTLNHTLLTIEALRRRHLAPVALFLVGSRHESNRATLVRLAGVPQVFAVPPFAPLDTAALDGWLSAHPAVGELFAHA